MFLGVGLKRGMAIAVFVGLFWIIAKVILNKYPVKGLTETVNVL